MKKSANGEKAAPKEQTVVIPEINIQRAAFTLVGTSPLLVDRFTDKAKGKIAGPQSGEAPAPKEMRNPEAESLAARYLAQVGKQEIEVFPSSGIKGAAVEAAPYCHGLDKKLIRGAIHMTTEFLPIVYERGKPHTAYGRNKGSGGRVPRYRYEYHGWSIKVELEFDAGAISVAQIAGLLRVAGFRIGIGNWTVQKNGFHGKFTIR